MNPRLRFSRLMLLALALAMAGCGEKSPRVIVYASQDQVYSEPILAQFQAGSGIRVDALYDSEAVKTVGLVKRLLGERARPRCDIFWNNEELRTRQLAARDIFRNEQGWVSFGYRSRRMVINTDRLDPERSPRSLSELTNKTWRGKVALAYPLFGSTATHFLALRQHWGTEAWLAWCRALESNHPLVVDGNSVVAQMVGRGEAWVGLTDSDDIAAGQRDGLPIAALPLDEEMLLIENTVGIIRNGPHARAADALFAYLRRPGTVRDLVARGALEGEIKPGQPTLAVDWEGLLQDMDEATAQLREIFLR